MLSTTEKLDLMTDLFVHDQSSFAEQVYEQDKGVIYYPRREGRCTHTPKHRPRDCPDVVEVQFTSQHLLAHLKGEKTYAPYQLKDGLIKWVCIDIDGYSNISQTDLKSMVLELASVIHNKIGKQTFLVEDSGSKGYHIWLFFKAPIPVVRGYALGHWITSQVEPKPGMNLEVYPKQTTNKLFGNTVKLPLGIHQKTGNRCWFVSASFETYEDPWELMGTVRRIPLSWIDRHVPHIQINRKEQDDGELHQVPLCLINIQRNGGSEGVRDEAAFRIACYLRENGILEEFAETLLMDWNSRNHPPLDETQLSLKIESAYGAAYKWLPCGSPAFDSYCSSKCDFFESKVRRRWPNTEKDARGIISYE